MRRWEPTGWPLFWMFVWFGLSIGIGLIASMRGRRLHVWFAISLIASPLLAAIALVLTGPARTDET